MLRWRFSFWCWYARETEDDGEPETALPSAEHQSAARPQLTPDPVPAKAGTDPMVALRREIKNQIHGELLQRLDLKRMTAARVGTEEMQSKVRDTPGWWCRKRLRCGRNARLTRCWR